MSTQKAPRPKLGELLVRGGVLTADELDDALRAHDESGGPLGEILVERRLISPPKLVDMLALQRGWRPLGELLVARGMITEAELDDALTQQIQTGQPLGEVLEKRGLLATAALTRVLADQYELELETEGGFASGLRGEIERRHRARREGEPDADAPTKYEDHGAAALTARIAATAPSGDDRVFTLQAALEKRERTIEALALANQQRNAEIERLRADVAERDALIGELRVRLDRRKPRGDHEAGDHKVVPLRPAK